MRKLLAPITFVCALFFAVVTYVYVTQEKRIFIYKPLPQDHAFSFDAPFEELYFDVGEDARIHALHFFAENPKGTVLYFHGRGENLQTFWGEVSADFLERGYNVVIPDYRQFGKSIGPITQAAILSDALHIFDELQTRHPEDHFIVYGRSLGTSVATYVASKRPVKMLLLESPFFSLADAAPRNAPAFLPKFVIPMILKYPFPTNEWIQNVQAPIHIFHGTNDRVIPHDSSLRLLELLDASASFTSLEEATHNSVRHHPEYRRTLDALLEGEERQEVAQALPN